MSDLSLDEIGEVFDARALIESDLLRRAIPNMTAAVFERADEVLAAFDDALANEDVRVWGQMNWKFHSTLYAPANCPLTMGIVQNLNFNVDRYLRLHLRLPEATHRARTDHRRILELCRRKKSDEACDYLGKHILDAGDQLRKFLVSHREMRRDQSRRPDADQQAMSRAITEARAIAEGRLRSILVTGSSSGIGAAICRHLAGPGTGILVHAARNRAGCEAVAAALRDGGGTGRDHARGPRPAGDRA